MNLTKPFFLGRTKENMEADICKNQSKASQRNSSRKGTFCPNYGANYLSPPLQCSWGDLAEECFSNELADSEVESKCVIVTAAMEPKPGGCLCPEHLLRASKLRPAWLAGGKRGGFCEDHHGLHAGRRRMPAPKEATLGCFLKICTTLTLS